MAGVALAIGGLTPLPIIGGLSGLDNRIGSRRTSTALAE